MGSAPSSTDGWPDAEVYALVIQLYNHCDADASGAVEIEELVSVWKRIGTLVFGASFARDEDTDVEQRRIKAFLKARPWTATASVDAWSDCLKKLCDRAGNGNLEAFKLALRRMLAEAQLGLPKIIVGPVIGKVTDKTARILVEITHESVLTCVVSSTDDNVPTLRQEVSLNRGTPHVLKFESLRAATLYRVEFFGAEMLTDLCSFRTLPEGGWCLEDGHAPNIAVASCNNILTSRGLPASSSCDLWQDMRDRIERGSPGLDYLLHIGDNVYNDVDWCDIERGSKVLKSNTCKWGIAHVWMSNTPKEDWADHREDIVELFRDIYRETWGHAPTRWVLANVPNLMVCDDHEFRDDWGDRAEDSTPGTVDWFLADVAYQMYKEYQRQLYEDLDSTPSGAFHFHAFGDVGLAFLDVRVCKAFHLTPSDESVPMLGQSQWRVLEDVFAPRPESPTVFARCKALLVLVPEPVAYLSSTPTAWLGQYVIDDLLGMFSAPKHMPEISRLLRQLHAWRRATPDRDVMIVCGDVHEGGWSDLLYTDHLHPIARKLNPGLPKSTTTHIRQLITSAIAANVRSPFDAFMSLGARDVLGVVDCWGLGGGWWYRHCAWTQERNYALIDISHGGDSQVVIGGCLVEAGELEAKLLERRTTRDLAFSRTQGFCSFMREVRDNFRGIVRLACGCCCRRRQQRPMTSLPSVQREEDVEMMSQPMVAARMSVF